MTPEMVENLGRQDSPGFGDKKINLKEAKKVVELKTKEVIKGE